MSYAVSAALQEAVYQRLTGDATLTGLVGSAIYDAMPGGTMPSLYVSLGPETVRARADGSGQGAWHQFVVSVVTETAGFHSAKEVAGAVSDALVDADLSLNRGSMAGLHFYRARAQREGTGDMRRIDLTFRARVDDTTVTP